MLTAHNAQAEYRLWKVGTWEAGPAFAPNYQRAPIGDACFSPDGKLLVARIDNSTLVLVKLREAETLATLQTPEGLALHHPRFTPDGRQLWAHIHGGGFYVWDFPLIHQELRALNLDCDSGHHGGKVLAPSDPPIGDSVRFLQAASIQSF